MSDIENYIGAKKRTKSPEERAVAFHKLAQTFGAVDPATREFRDQCNKCGFSVVFRSGLSRDQTMKILSTPETTQILASH